jgi:hypothetical protein
MNHKVFHLKLTKNIEKQQQQQQKVKMFLKQKNEGEICQLFQIKRNGIFICSLI